MKRVEISTQNDLSFIVYLAKYFLIFPVNGPRNAKVNFKLLSLKTILSICFNLYSCLMLIFITIHSINNSKKITSISNVAFHLTVFVFTIFFTHVAKRWPNLMKEWGTIDLSMNNYSVGENIEKQMKLVTGVIMIMGVGEHVSYLISLRSININKSFWEIVDQHLMASYKFVFNFFPYSRYLAFFIQLTNWMFTLIWNYTDAYLIVMCIPITFRLRQIEKKILLMIKYKIKDLYHWKNVRDNFVRLSHICDATETCIGHLLVFSTGYKLFIILYQMLGVIKGRDAGQKEAGTVEEKLYFLTSLSVLIIRLVAVTYYTSSIDIVCQDIVGRLFSVPSELYNIEVERFLVSMKQSQPIITGCKLFKMKKSLILKMASVVVVYELVLINFSNQ